MSACAGIMCDSGAASISDCHVLVEPGITNPKAKDHSTHSKDEEDLATSEHMYVPVGGNPHTHLPLKSGACVLLYTHIQKCVIVYISGTGALDTLCACVCVCVCE